MTLLHWVDGGWSALRYTPTGEGIRVLEAVRLGALEVSNWCGDDAGPTRVVIPARAILCRAIRLGSGDDAALDHQLHADAIDRLGDSAPPHRLAATVLPSASSDDVRFGIAVAWPERNPIEMPVGLENVIGVPDVVGLLSLMGDQRADLPLVWHDPADGSTALVLAGLGRLAVRSTHMANFGNSDAATRLVIESAVQATWPLEEARSLAPHIDTPSADQPFLSLPESARSAIGSRCDGEIPENTAHFGIAIACALATTDDLAPLTVLRPSLPIHEPTFGERAHDTLSKPEVAARLAVVLILVLLFGPMIANGIRFGMLRVTHGNLDEAVTTAAMVEHRNKLYAQLGSGSIPVTKLLADIAASTPLGIKVDSVKMGAGEPVRISGDATAFEGHSAAELIGTMKAQMQASRVFKNVTVDWGAQSNLGVRSFKLNATIGSASVRPAYSKKQDFAAWTHQQRKYELPTTAEGGPDPRRSVAAIWDPGEATTSGPAAGPSTPAGGGEPANLASLPTGTGGSRPSSGGGSSTAPPPPPKLVGDTSSVPRRTGSSGGANRPDRGGRDVSAGDTGSRSIAGEGARSGDLSAEDLGAIPEILSDEQIATLSRAETLAKVNEVSAARKRVTDPELDKQLLAYFKRLFAHLREIPREDGS